MECNKKAKNKVKTIHIRNSRAVELINQLAHEQERSASNCAAFVIIRALGRGDDRGPREEKQGEN